MTDLDRLIEAVARAMCESMAIDPDDIDPMVICDKENNPLPLWQYYDDVAAAAILATLKGIREPTLEQGLIGAAQIEDCRERECGDAIRHAYGQMIDRLIQDIAPEGKGE
jgi:hypothetical protein